MSVMAEEAPPAVLYIREHREAVGLGPFQLAVKAGLAPTSVYRLERGQYGGVTFATLAAIAHALGVKPGALFEPPA